jgi:hypothetical protein
MRNLIIIFLSLITLTASAQSDTTDLKTTITSNFPDNTAGFITPAKLRNVALELMRSNANLLENNSFTGTVTATDSIKSLDGFYTWSGSEWVGISGVPQTKKISISSAEVLTLNSDSIQFDIDVPSGYAIMPISCIFKSTYGGTPYATNINLRVRSVGAASQVFGFSINYSADQFASMGISGLGAIQYIDGADFQVYVNTGNPTAGNSTIVLYLTYILMKL